MSWISRATESTGIALLQMLLLQDTMSRSIHVSGFEPSTHSPVVVYGSRFMFAPCDSNDDPSKL